MNQKTIDMYGLMATMELDYQEFHNLQCGRSFEEVEQKVEDFKIRLKKQYKLMVKKYHPDVNPDVDPDHIKHINNAYELLSQIKFVPKQPVMQNVIIRYSYTSPANYTSSTNSYTSSTNGFWQY